MVDEKDRFISCHLKIYEPTYIVENSVTIIIWTFLGIIVLSISYYYLRQKLKKKQMMLKMSRRKSKRSSVTMSNDTSTAKLHKIE